MLRLWNKFIIFVKGYYNDHKDDIIIAFILGTILSILFKTTVNTWFISFLVTITYQIIVNIIQLIMNKERIGMKLHPIIINVLIGSFISLLFTVWL